MSFASSYEENKKAAKDIDISVCPTGLVTR